MRITLENRNALVCGSTQGIGKAIALQFAASGANVTLMARNRDSLENLRSCLANNGKQKHHFIIADFDDNLEVSNAVSRHLAKVQTFHILVNNSGGPTPGSIETATKLELLSAFQHHLINFHQISQLLIPEMKNCGFGRIINVISTSVKQPLPNLGVSNTVRAAVANWSKTLANEVGQFGITVNNLLPGATNTIRLQNIIENKALNTNKETHDIANEELASIPLRRFGKPEEFAQVCTFIASEFASYISGVNLPIDGGRTSSL